MNVLAIQGSPRPDGNTRAVLDMVLDGARAAGVATDVIQLIELKNLTGCMECFGCQGTLDEPGCVVDDDMQAILERAIRAQAIVWATPVFCWSPSWLIKIAMDRMYCMFKFQDDSEVVSLLRDRRLATVITAGGGENDGADLVAETFRRLAQFSQCRWGGAFVAANLSDPASIRADSELTERATAFGRQLVA